MSQHENIKKDIEHLQQITDSNNVLDVKLDELVELLTKSDIDSDKVKAIRQRLNRALDETDSYREQIDAYQKVADSPATSREELLDEFSVLLAGQQVDSEMSKKYLRAERLSKLFLLIIGLLLITLGIAMIIIPAPPYFEMFTIYYFSMDDGITLMDVISLLIVLAGVFLVVKSVYKRLSTDK